MPIKPENRARYPKEWPQIRARILARAGNRCEHCGVVNHAYGARDLGGEWRSEQSIDNMKSDIGEMLFGGVYPKIIRIVLTVAHYPDRTIENCADDNLLALCQRCHLRLDAKQHALAAEATRQARRLGASGQLEMEIAK